jgi:hypothetical protein
MPSPEASRRNGKLGGVDPKPERISPEAVRALALAGVTQPRVAQMLGLSVDTLQRRFPKCWPRRGPSPLAADTADIFRRMLDNAKASDRVGDQRLALEIVARLAGEDFAPLAKAIAPPKDDASDLPPVQPEIGHDETPA